MSMGYDEDDPRAEATRAKMRAGVWKLAQGDRPVISKVQLHRPGRTWHGSFNR